jgi:hypothetical protein
MPNESLKIKINRAPVLTLWASVVAERLGYKPAEALGLAKELAGLNAQSKGQRLGIFTPAEKNSDTDAEPARNKKAQETSYVELMGRSLAVVNTPEGLRAIAGGEPVTPESVERYLRGKFGENLPEVRAAMEELSRAFTPEVLALRAFSLYEQFRPKIPEGVTGWGAAGELDLDTLHHLATR